MMATINELINSLPPKLVYCGEVFNLNWSVSQHDRRCVQLCYRNVYDDVLSIENDYFFVEAERHYSAFTMLQLILFYAEDTLAYIYYQDQEAYHRILDNIYANSIALQDYCTVNPKTYELMTGGNYSTVIV